MSPDSGEHEARIAALERSAELLADLLRDETTGELHDRLSALVVAIPKWNPDRDVVVNLIIDLEELQSKAAYYISKHEPTDEHF